MADRTEHRRVQGLGDRPVPGRSATHLPCGDMPGERGLFFRDVGRRCLGTALLAVSVYLMLTWVYRRFPYIGEGGSVVVAEKYTHVTSQPIFSGASDRRLVIFGNSKALSGFIPDYFDELSGHSFTSYNLGMPDSQRFVHLLEDMVEMGNTPTHVFITILWEDPPASNPLVLIREDKEVLDRLFPFHSLPRDMAIFIRRSRFRGGLQALYAETARDSRQVLEDRGYYFISGQSVYPDDRLPDDFGLRTDTPGRARVSESAAHNEWYRRLMRVLEQHHIHAYLVPTYYRENEYAPRDHADPERVRFFADNPHIEEFDGPEYLLYPNRLFSDPVHLNREGARRHTEELWSRFSLHLEAEGALKSQDAQAPQASMRF